MNVRMVMFIYNYFIINEYKILIKFILHNIHANYKEMYMQTIKFLVFISLHYNTR